MLKSTKIFLYTCCLVLTLGSTDQATAGCVGSTSDFHCGDTITESCTMNEDLTTLSYSCFTIGANNVVVDGGGHSISGPYVLPDGPSGGKGIGATTYDNVTIRNFTLSGFYWGIMLSSGTSSCTVQDNAVSGAYFGIELSSSTGDTVTGNIVTGSQVGIKLNNSTQNTLSQNSVSSSATPFLLYTGSHDNLLDKNISSSNSNDGIRVLQSERNVLSNNVITGSGWDGIYLWKGPGTIIRNNEISGSAYNGISIEDSAGGAVKYNKISGNSGSGIQLFSDAPDNVLLGNKLCGNGNGTSTFDVENGADNRGSSNTCATNSGYKDDNAASGCAFACGCGCVSASTTYDCGDTITESCTLNCDLVSSGAYCLNVTANNIIVDGHGLTIHGNGTGAAIQAVGATGATIRNFGIDNFSSGIALVKQIIPTVRNSTQNHILSNRVENTSQQAIYLENSTDNSIGTNILNDNNKGINLQATSTGNNIYNNIVARSAVDGIYFAANADNNTLADNTFCASGNRDVNSAGTNSGTGSTCTKTGGTYHDDGKPGCTHTCGICSDGTFFGECSNDKPKYCMEGTLIDDCLRCGCDTGNCNGSTGACEEIPPPSGVCVGATKEFACGDSVTESCTLNGHMASKGNCFTVTADNVTIDGAGYSITGDKTGMAVSTLVHDNLTVKRLNIRNFYYGINLYYSNNSLVENCSVIDNEGPGIWLQTHTQNTTVRNNVVQRNDARGIYLNEAANNTIEGNTVTLNKRGIYLINASTGNTIKNNTITDNQFDGIILNESGNNTISGNVLARNTVEGLALIESHGNTIQSNNIRHHSEAAIILSDSNSNTFSGNFVTDNLYDGILLSGSLSNHLNGNTFCSNGDGTTYFDIDNGSATNTGSNNMCTSANNYDDSEAGTGCARACDLGGCESGTTLFRCGDTVTKSCTLTASLASEETCFTVGANNVTIDGNGFSISGNNVYDTYGVYAAGRSKVTVKNLEIYNFYGGVHFNAITQGAVTSSTIHHNKNGITLGGSSNNQITNNTVNANEFSGISLGESSGNNQVRWNTADANGYGIRLLSNSEGNTLSDNEISGSTYTGIRLEANLNVLTSNRACGNAVDIYQNGSNTGDINWCVTTQNWNDTGTTGCSYGCSPRSRSLPWLQLLLLE